MASCERSFFVFQQLGNPTGNVTPSPDGYRFGTRAIMKSYEIREVGRCKPNPVNGWLYNRHATTVICRVAAERSKYLWSARTNVVPAKRLISRSVLYLYHSIK